MKKYRGLLLDFYGTLVHEDDEIVSGICEQIQRSAGVTTTPQEIGRYWWMSFSRLFQQAYGDTFRSQRRLGLESLADTIKYFDATDIPSTLIASQHDHWGAPPIFADTKPFLSFVAQASIPVCIVSNIDRIDLEKALVYHGLNFENIVTSDDVKAYKPRQEIFEAALEALGLPREEVLHVGDSRTSDVAGARASRIPVAWLNRFGKEDSEEWPVTHTIRNLDELQSILIKGVDDESTLQPD